MARQPDPAVVKRHPNTPLKGSRNLSTDGSTAPTAGPGGESADSEDLAVQLGQAVPRNRIDQALARQATAVRPEDETCPGCGRPVEPNGTTEPCAGATPVGAARYDVPKHHRPKFRAPPLLPVSESGH
jgi:hypothetical protein